MKVKIIVNLTAAVMLMVGFVILIAPYWRDYQQKKENDRVISEFVERTKTDDTESSIYSSEDESASVHEESENSQVTLNADDGETETQGIKFPELYAQMKEYNRRIYRENQSELKDAFSYTTNDFDFSFYGITDDIAGYITIDALNLKLPLYIGSSLENMRKGATIMNKTSMPIGGINTNCVIAAHRSIGFFGDIELINIGDKVIINNLWRKMDYKVVKIIVIDPFDVDKIKIFPGQDMVTLITCHPYNFNTNRYVVYCVRDSESDGSENVVLEIPGESSQVPDSLSEPITYDELPDGIAYESSTKSIKYEHIVRISGIGLTGLFLLIFLFMFVRNTFHIRNTKQ